MAISQPSIVNSTEEHSDTGLKLALSDLSMSYDVWMNVSSPNSLYMYDQEPHLVPNVCNTSTFSDEFDLQPQYEMSDDFFTQAISEVPRLSVDCSDQTPTLLPRNTSTVTDLSCFTSHNLKPDKKNGHNCSRNKTTLDTSNMTLSQLNSNYDDTTSQKSFTSSINSEDLAILESEILLQEPCGHVPDFSLEKDVPHLVNFDGFPKKPVNFNNNNLRQWIQQTQFNYADPGPPLSLCNLEQAQHGFSPHKVPQISHSSVSSTINDGINFNSVYKDDETTRHRYSPHRSVDLLSDPSSPLRILNTNKRYSSTVTKCSHDDDNDDDLKKMLHTTEPHKLSPASRAKRRRYDSECSVRTTETYSSDDDEESYDSDASWVHNEKDATSSMTKKHSFWQYNLQSKGPKGKRLIKAVETSDPHILPRVEDPVFDQVNINTGLTHGGKARRGDGNDILANPKKLYQLGNELRSLMEQISEFCPKSEVPASVRSKSRKEKNKIASRVCRLRKKAQHEANKVKRFGLEQEHSQLLKTMELVKQILYNGVKRNNFDTCDDTTVTEQVDTIIKSNLDCGEVAGNTVSFVNTVIDKVTAGDPSGGLHY